MKKTLAFIMLTLSLALCGCNGNKNAVDTSDSNQRIQLNVENYNYYLSIQKTLMESGAVMGGTYRYSVYSVTVNGAVNGIYENCILTYKYRDSDELHDIRLNAAGFATFKYSVVNGNEISYVSASGEIYM